MRVQVRYFKSQYSQVINQRSPQEDVHVARTEGSSFVAQYPNEAAYRVAVTRTGLTGTRISEEEITEYQNYVVRVTEERRARAA